MSSVLDGDVLSVEREREACRGGRSIERERVERRYLGGEEEINQEVRVCLGGLRIGDTERQSGVEYGGGRVVVQNEVGGGERVIDGGWGKQG